MTMIGKLYPYLFLCIDASSSMSGTPPDAFKSLLKRWAAIDGIASVLEYGHGQGELTRYLFKHRFAKEMAKVEYNPRFSYEATCHTIITAIRDIRGHCQTLPIGAVEFAIFGDSADDWSHDQRNTANKAITQARDLGWKLLAIAAGSKYPDGGWEKYGFHANEIVKGG